MELFYRVTILESFLFASGYDLLLKFYSLIGNYILSDLVWFWYWETSRVDCCSVNGSGQWTKNWVRGRGNKIKVRGGKCNDGLLMIGKKSRQSYHRIDIETPISFYSSQQITFGCQNLTWFSSLSIFYVNMMKMKKRRNW